MKDRSSPLFILVAMITAIAALIIAKAILLPLALSILLTFLLTPIADRLERCYVPRILAVVSIVAVSFATLCAVGWVVTDQLMQLGLELPKHEKNLTKKITELRPNSPTLNQAIDTLVRLRNKITQAAPADGRPDKILTDAKDESASSGTNSSTAKDATTSAFEITAKIDQGEPPKDAIKESAKPNVNRDAQDIPKQAPQVAFEVVAPAPSLFTYVQEWVGQLVAPITTAGLVIVLVLFLLLDRENQRSRIVQLFGRSHMHATAEAVHDVAHRVGRYLRMLFLLNAGYGLAVAGGLWVIGVPGAIMWGVLGFSLRFLPYIGPLIAAALPVMVSIATTVGWTQPMLVLGWYLIVELVSNNIVEPLVYGNTTGVSTVGVIIAAIFWTWLWGPIGLILSMPMTVSLLVAARYVPQLRFLTILLADRPPLAPAERVYQRLLAFDYHETLKLAHVQLKETPLVKYYDDVLLPALLLAEQDRQADLLNDEQAAFVLEATEDLVDELEATARRDEERARADEAEGAQAAGGNVVTGPARSPARVLCIPLSDVADEIAAQMLAQLLKAEGFQADAGAAASLTSEMVEQVTETDSDIVVISVLPPIAPRDSRLLWKRLRTRYPKLPIVVGFWTAVNDKDALAEPVEDAASKVVTTLAEASAVVRAMAAQQPRIAKTG